MNPSSISDSRVKNTKTEPCGCTLTEYVSGRRTYSPCVPCGLMRAGHALAEAAGWRFWRRRAALLAAGNALAAVATTIQAEKEA